ncbi:MULTISPECIES: GNAT family N-acetyltransferase [Roseomonadaceae]|uniref:GNAT family N-acetyltransferase n=1 Tax=Falsiroseomonas oleicola TaxID=2801474 RepID=A0ABS6H7Q5_9PROT|nr:GNAT family N-acyltransferase [Roseomonas oleicola]MBU8544728.1 GNAT family N-acetyltransferase [Roseomonas oleicola]
MSVDGPLPEDAAPSPEPARIAPVTEGFEELRAGNLGLRLAETPAEIDAAQALRYRVFYEEMGAQADPAMRAARRDVDEFDAVADHLLVLDHDLGQGPEAVVGTYRLIRRPAAERLGGFYSAAEYDIAPLLAFDGQVLELGRSCVAESYRTRGTLQLLWRGIAAFVFRHRIDLMFGCASLPGTDLEALAPQLSYLYANHLAPPALRPRAVAERYVAMDRLPAGALDMRAALGALPPLVKGYLRLGGFVGDGAVIDRQFNTTDVCIVVKTDLITDKYFRHYERTAGPS